MQLQVINSPFNEEQAELLNALLPTLTTSQKFWLSGFLTASDSVTKIVSQSAVALESSINDKNGQNNVVSKDVTILYGSQTGNAHGIAEKTAKKLAENGFNVTVLSMSDFKPNNLKKVDNLLIVVSTHGEGEPPDNAITFHEFLNGRRAPKLDQLQYSVLSLGDTSYEFFCQTGKDFDKRLEELGGTRITSRVDCDVDYDEAANKWMANVLTNLTVGKEKQVSIPSDRDLNPKAAAAVYSRTNPFKAEVLENINLNGRGSNKETRHVELSLEGSGLTYEPGDSLGVYPENDPELVEFLLNELTWSADEKVTVNKEGDVRSLKDALHSYYEITSVTKALLKNVAKFSTNKDLHDLLAPGNEGKLKEYTEGRDLIDLVRDFGVWGSSAQEFVSILRKIPVRLYSIASSNAANPEEVHLTIGAVRYEAHGRKRKGVCSILCAERLQPGDTLPVYVQKNQNFKLPENLETPIIMVGPGTGVAPFRSFMQEREESQANGKSWMFFGDQHFVTDFLYQTEWQSWLKNGVLTKMDVAFSRDSEEKVYVQHKMLEHSKELFKWFEEGAFLYICGDKNSMARDVQNTLIEIITKEGGMTLEQAEEYLAAMKKQKRYQRDVY